MTAQALPNGLEAPIFIGGLSGSGKTPLRIVLGAHPEISMTRRTYLWPRYFGAFGDLRDPANVDRCLAAILDDGRARRLHPDADRIRREFLEGPPTYANIFALFHAHHAERLGKRRWGEQLGHVERFADPIFAAFPAARMIHMIRDPRTRWVALARPGSLGKAALGWETARWQRSVHLAARNRARYPDRYRVVLYESLVARPFETAREVSGFLGEELSPEMEEAIDALRLEGGFDGDAARSQRLGQPPFAAEAFVERCVRHELRTFGYEPRVPAAPLHRRLSFWLIDFPVNRATMAAWGIGRRKPTAKAEAT